MTFRVMYWFIERPEVVAAIIPIFFVLLYFIMKDYVVRERVSRLARVLLLISRTLIFFLLLLALASPYTHKQTVVQGEPFVKILLDNSSSFQIYDQDYAARLEKTLKQSLNAEVNRIGYDETSNLGDGLLDNLEKGESVLLVTDGNSNYGTTLGDVALHAARLNSSINAVRLEPLDYDASVRILGPDKVVADVESTFKVKIDSTMKDHGHNTIITFDNETLQSGTTKTEEFVFTKTFSSCYHQITASIDDKDYFPENNVYYKTIKVVKKPKIMFYTQRDAPILGILTKLYDVTITNELTSIDPAYLGLVLNDIPKELVESKVGMIKEFVSEGNGLFVIGGENSFDRGDYKGSNLETLLPVNVGAAEKKGEATNIVIVIDISGSTGASFGGNSVQDVQKALAVGLLDNINQLSNVGVVAFNTKPYLVSDLSPLKDKKDELEAKIKSLLFFGDTRIEIGIDAGRQLLNKTFGARNMLLLTDGLTGGLYYAQKAAEDANEKDNINIYAVSTGDNPDAPGTYFYGSSYVKAIAEAGHGTFLRANEAPQKIKVDFGEQTQGPDRNRFGLVTADQGHFITEEIDLKNPLVTGYNSVLPKSTAKTLVTLDSGEPILNAWRYGLGRVVTLALDDGTSYAGNLLNKDNSKLISRSVNWIIGNPERNEKEYVDIQDGVVNESIQVKLKTEFGLSSDKSDFYKIGENLYATTVKHQDTGFHYMLRATYAVNYKIEYELLNFNNELEGIAAATNGKVFDKEDFNGMVEAIKSQSKKSVDKKTYLRWPFLIAALVLFLIEVCIRKVAENRKRDKFDKR